MNILVVLRMVPDVVEELEIAPDGKSLDAELLRLIPSESDDHALEEALLIKEQSGARVTVLAPAAPDVDDALYSALAKGADRAIRIDGMAAGMSTRRMAGQVAETIRSIPGLLPADLILTGVQAYDDLDGLVAPLLAHHLGLPHLGIVTKVVADMGRQMVTAVREFPGGVRGEFEVAMPAVLGIQAAEKPPRYLPVAKLRAVMKSQKIELSRAPGPAAEAPLAEIVEMRKPEVTGHAEMLDGTAPEVATKLTAILAGHGVV